MISVIIPHYNRATALVRTLKAFERQSYRDFEIVVVDDGSAVDQLAIVVKYHTAAKYSGAMQVVVQNNRGPATARNTGVRAASGDILLFVGDDCIPHRDLVLQHALSHARYPEKEKVVQGFTEWYPDIKDDFCTFLTEGSGIQVNVKALKNPDGTWKERTDGFFLTTNVSITKRLFNNIGGFIEEFPAAAWEDIAVGIKITQWNMPTYFNPMALNYHAHKQTLDGYIRRQITEGGSRLVLCKYFPEMAQNLIDSEALRQYSEDTFGQLVAMARETHNSKAQDIQELRYQRWHAALRYASIKGLKEGIEKRGGIWQALPHVHTGEIAHHICGAAAAIERGDPEYAQVEMQWALTQHPDNHAIWCAWGEVMMASNQKEEAVAAFQRALELGPGSEWAKKRLAELQ